MLFGVDNDGLVIIKRKKIGENNFVALLFRELFGQNSDLTINICVVKLLTRNYLTQLKSQGNVSWFWAAEV